MHLVIEAPPDPGRYVRLVSAAQGRQFRRLWLIGALVVVAGIAEIALYAKVPMGVGLLCGGLVVVLMPTLVLRRGRSAAGATVNGPWTYVLSEHGVSASGR